MKRNDQKIDTAIVKALNEVCENLKNRTIGFCWLTHFVDYANFPQSLKLVFVFDTHQSLADAKDTTLIKTISQLVEASLKGQGLPAKQIDSAVLFDTEDNGADFNDAKWCRKYR